MCITHIIGYSEPALVRPMFLRVFGCARIRKYEAVVSPVIGHTIYCRGRAMA
jgi:hypothetical protein